MAHRPSPACRQRATAKKGTRERGSFATSQGILRTLRAAVHCPQAISSLLLCACVPPQTHRRTANSQSIQRRTNTCAPTAGTFISCRLTDQGLRIIIQLKGKFDNRTRETPKKFCSAE